MFYLEILSASFF